MRPKARFVLEADEKKREVWQCPLGKTSEEGLIGRQVPDER